MNSLDLILLLPILIGFVFGLFKGLIKELTGLVAVILGFIVAIRFEHQLTEQIISHYSLTPTVAQALSYGTIFIAVALVLLIIAGMLNKLVSEISLGGLNSLLGGLFGALKYAILISVLLNIFNLLDGSFKLIDSETKKNSLSYRVMLNLGPQVWDETKEFLDQKPNGQESEKTKPNE